MARLTLALLAASWLLPAARAEAPARTLAPLVGVAAHPLWEGADAGRELARAGRTGARLVRIDVGWATLQPEARGRWSSWALQRLDRVVRSAERHRLRPLLTVFGTPCWATGRVRCGGRWWRRGITAVPPRRPGDYARALAFLVRRYKQRVAAWEVWNEPNQRAFFAGSAAAYAHLLRAVAAQVDPAAVILGGSIAEADTGFVEALYVEDAPFDALSVHPYVGDRGAAALDERLDAVRAVQRDHGDTRPVWLAQGCGLVHFDATEGTGLGARGRRGHPGPPADRRLRTAARPRRRPRGRLVLAHRRGRGPCRAGGQLRAASHRRLAQAELGRLPRGGREVILRPSPQAPDVAPRVCVIVPCFNDGELLPQALASVVEDEPIEVVVVDDASTDPATLDVLDELRRAGVRVVRHARNRHLSAARMTGLAETTAPYVYPLDSDDEAIPGALAAMADRLDADPGANVVAGDYEEFGTQALLRAVPDELDPFRIAYINEYPVTALFRRSALEAIGGWRTELRGYEDWDVWMALAERGFKMVHLGAGRPIYRRRLHGPRMLTEVRRRHTARYRELRHAHPALFADLRIHRRRSPMPWRRKLLYPFVYGGRRRTEAELHVKRWLDRHRLWTLRR